MLDQSVVCVKTGPTGTICQMFPSLKNSIDDDIEDDGGVHITLCESSFYVDGVTVEGYLA